MVQALTTEEIDTDLATKRVVKRAKRARYAGFEGLSFESLNGPQKDALLKALAIKAGLIEDSED